MYGLISLWILIIKPLLFVRLTAAKITRSVEEKRELREKTSRLKLFRSIYRNGTKETIIVPASELQLKQQNKQR